MGTRATIRSQCRAEISQTNSANSDYTDTELNGLIDEAVTFAATLVEWPREFKEITPVDGTADYDITSTALTYDTLKIRTAYFGDRSIAGDISPLSVLTEEGLRTIDPNWLDQSSGSKGTPRYLIQKSKTTITIHPRPDSDASASGKKLILNRVYYPGAMSSDSSTPDLPVPYHDLLKFYVSYLCYSGKLRDTKIASEKLKKFTEQVALLKPIVDKETEEGFRFVFSGEDSIYEDSGDITA